MVNPISGPRFGQIASLNDYEVSALRQALRSPKGEATIEGKSGKVSIWQHLQTRKDQPLAGLSIDEFRPSGAGVDIHQITPDNGEYPAINHLNARAGVFPTLRGNPIIVRDDNAPGTIQDFTSLRNKLDEEMPFRMRAYQYAIMTDSQYGMTAPGQPGSMGFSRTFDDFLLRDYQPTLQKLNATEDITARNQIIAEIPHINWQDAQASRQDELESELFYVNTRREPEKASIKLSPSHHGIALSHQQMDTLLGKLTEDKDASVQGVYDFLTRQVYPDLVANHTIPIGALRERLDNNMTYPTAILARRKGRQEAWIRQALIDFEKRTHEGNMDMMMDNALQTEALRQRALASERRKKLETDASKFGSPGWLLKNAKDTEARALQEPGRAHELRAKAADDREAAQKMIDQEMAHYLPAMVAESQRRRLDGYAYQGFDDHDVPVLTDPVTEKARIDALYKGETSPVYPRSQQEIVASYAVNDYVDVRRHTDEVHINHPYITRFTAVQANVPEAGRDGLEMKTQASA